MNNQIIQQRSPEWHEQRKMRISGSRIGAILGLSPWQKPDDVLREKPRPLVRGGCQDLTARLQISKEELESWKGIL